MKLTLEPDHPIARAIRDATTGPDPWNVTLSVDSFDRRGGHSRRLSLRVQRWEIRAAGRHHRDNDEVFECELIDADAERRWLRDLAVAGSPAQRHARLLERTHDKLVEIGVTSPAPVPGEPVDVAHFTQDRHA